MCGIVGHLGPRDSVEVVLEGLRRLEYRGYDSSGICFRTPEHLFNLYKRTGKLEVLSEELKSLQHNALSCVGHTRWATHGKVNEINAHPHVNEIFSIVHNGIIENYSELKTTLKKNKANFFSETDSEVFLVLLTDHYNKLLSQLLVSEGKKDAIELPVDLIEKLVSESIRSAFKEIHGGSAFVIQHHLVDGIWSIKRGAPLVCGTSVERRDALVSSDPYALVGLSDKLYFPEDEVLCFIHDRNDTMVNFYELDGSESTRFLSKTQDMSLEIATKGGFDHYMCKEIFEQPGLIRMFKHYYIEGDGRNLLEKMNDLQKKIDRILIIGCGSAWHAGLLMKSFFEQNNKIPTHVDLASEFRYRDPVFQKGDLAIFISQSGETADTLAAQDLCRKAGVPTLAIVNVEGSTLFRESDYNILTRAGVEVGVASTKAFTLQCLAGYVLSMHFAGLLDQKNIVLDRLAEQMDILLASEGHIKEVAEKIHRYKGFIFTGRGELFSIALEGALKLKEIAYVHAEGYASGELKHGPIALIDETMINIALIGPKLYEKAISNLQEVKARKGIIVGVGATKDFSLEEQSDFFIPVPLKDIQDLNAVQFNVVGQLLSYHVARFKGTDIDRPRNLAKSVTVE